MNKLESKTNYPDVVLKIYGELYAISSKCVTSIMRLPDYNKIPGAPKGILGIIPFRGTTIPILDLRTAFEMPTLQEEYKEFVTMLEDRKQDHIRWVNALEESIKSGNKFALTTDPHKCAFGLWYDHFESESSAINFHLKKLEEPHTKLHLAALEIEKCSQEHSKCEREKCLKDIFFEVKETYMPTIISILDEAKKVFESAFAEMVIILEEGERRIGLVVDEVLSVGELEVVPVNPEFYAMSHSVFLSGVRQAEGMEQLILYLDDSNFITFSEQIPKET